MLAVFDQPLISTSCSPNSVSPETRLLSSTTALSQQAIRQLRRAAPRQLSARPRPSTSSYVSSLVNTGTSTRFTTRAVALWV